MAKCLIRDVELVLVILQRTRLSCGLKCEAISVILSNNNNNKYSICLCHISSNKTIQRRITLHEYTDYLHVLLMNTLVIMYSAFCCVVTQML